MPLVAEQPGGLDVASPRRVAQPQAVQRIDTGNIPLPLLELTIRCVSEHIETFPDLHLPSEIAQRVLAYLLSRAWLNVDTFVRLQHCLLLSLELPNFAPLSEQGGEVWLPLLVKHTNVARLDISYAAEVTDAAFRRVATLASLTALNISSCVALSDAALAYVARLLSLKQLKMDSLPRITDDGLVHLWPLRSLQWLSVSGCDSLGPAATSMLVEKGGTPPSHGRARPHGPFVGRFAHPAHSNRPRRAPLPASLRGLGPQPAPRATAPRPAKVASTDGR